jgi:UDPglucose 6-dehydrogenase
MHLAVIGCGYVGLVTGACLADVGHDVVATDVDAGRIETLKAGRLPIHEPGLDRIMARVTNAAHPAGSLRFTTECSEAVQAADAIFICVGTPPLASGDADLSAIDNVARQIAAVARTPQLVIEKSTVPAQTGEQLRRALQVYGRGSQGSLFRVASNPEFLREGTAIADFFHPDRIVVGVEDSQSEKQLREIYGPILDRRFHCSVHDGNCPPGNAPEFLVTTIASAELIKHASNSFLGLKIAYANVIADLCERLGGDVREVTRAMGMDPRIGPQFLNAGLGFGGFCLPKDIQAFTRLAERCGVDFTLLKETERINKARIGQLIEKVRKALWVVKEKRIGVLGLAFKPNTDDVRFAPAIEIVRCLQAEHAIVRVTDPVAMEKARPLLPGVEFVADAYQATSGADALLLLTEWEDYRKLDWPRIRKEMARPLLIDARNALSPSEMRTLGFEYDCFGRPQLNATSAPSSA